MMTEKHADFQVWREQLLETHRKVLARLDATEAAHAVAVDVVIDWRAGREGREGRVYLGEGSIMVTLALATGEIFADAEEAFDQAQDALRETFPADWACDWDEVRDDSNATEARRQSVLRAAPEGGAWYTNGAAVWLTIAARVGDGSACQVIKVGERRALISTSAEKMVPVFKAVCPGDPVPMAAE